MFRSSFKLPDRIATWCFMDRKEARGFHAGRRSGDCSSHMLIACSFGGGIRLKYCG